MKVNLTYFKASGKFYSSGIYNTKNEFMFRVFDEVRDMRKAGKLPGLCEGGGQDFIILVDSSEVPNGYPGLIL
jgi:hypothetical protein